MSMMRIVTQTIIRIKKPIAERIIPGGVESISIILTNKRAFHRA
jgi:hypothetical protein